jgi:hypothetical protein
MAQSELRSVCVAFPELFEQLFGMQSHAAEHILYHFAGIASFAFETRKRRLDAARQDSVRNTQCDLLLLAGGRKVELEERLEIVGSDAFGNVVQFSQSLFPAPEQSCQYGASLDDQSPYSNGKKLTRSTIFPNFARS